MSIGDAGQLIENLCYVNIKTDAASIKIGTGDKNLSDPLLLVAYDGDPERGKRAFSVTSAFGVVNMVENDGSGNRTAFGEIIGGPRSADIKDPGLLEARLLLPVGFQEIAFGGILTVGGAVVVEGVRIRGPLQVVAMDRSISLNNVQAGMLHLSTHSEVTENSATGHEDAGNITVDEVSVEGEGNGTVWARAHGLGYVLVKNSRAQEWTLVAPERDRIKTEGEVKGVINIETAVCFEEDGLATQRL